MKNDLSAPLRLRASALKTEQFAGLILAGGEGKRWGGPKAWATLPDGKTFLEACFGALRESGGNPIVATLPLATRSNGKCLALLERYMALIKKWAAYCTQLRTKSPYPDRCRSCEKRMPATNSVTKKTTAPALTMVISHSARAVMLAGNHHSSGRFRYSRQITIATIAIRTRIRKIAQPGG